jgi:Flp pilus assembly protein TadG
VTALRMGRRPTVRRDGERGQGLVEFAMLVPVFLLILVGMLEFGFIFDHTMTISYATREGARSGSAFASGNTTTMICNPADGGLDVDKNIVAAVQRVLEAPGSQVVLSRVQEIRIYKATASGAQSGGSANVWNYAAGSGPVVDGQPLDFTRSTSNWNACSRVNFWSGGAAPDSLGVSVTYSYQYITPLRAILQFFGPNGTPTLPITDRSVMALNPTD